MKSLPKLVHQPRRGCDIDRQHKKFKKLTLSYGRTTTIMHHHQSRPHLYRQPTLLYHLPVVYYYPPAAAVPTSPIVVVPRNRNCSQVDNRGLYNKKRKLCGINPTSKCDSIGLNNHSRPKDNGRLLLQESKPKKSNTEKPTNSDNKVTPGQDSVQVSDNNKKLASKLSVDSSKKDELKDRFTSSVSNNNTSDDSEEDEIGAWVYQQSQTIKAKTKKNTKAKSRQTCGHDGCLNFVQRGGVCWKHGAKNKAKICMIDGCTNYAKGGCGGVCWKHGAKYKTKLFMKEGCFKLQLRNGCCVGHDTSLAVESLLSLRDAPVTNYKNG